MTPNQLKAARRLLGWSRDRLGAYSDTSYHVIRTFEATGRVAIMYDWTGPSEPLAVIRATLEVAGVEFTNGDAPGVRLRKVGA